MGNGDVVVFSFRTLLGKIGSEGVIPDADVLGGIEKSVAEVTGTAFLHVRVGIVQLAGLVSRRRKSGIGQKLVGRIEAGKITDFRQDHGIHAVADTGNGEDIGRNIADQFGGFFPLSHCAMAFWEESARVRSVPCSDTDP